MPLFIILLAILFLHSSTGAPATLGGGFGKLNRFNVWRTTLHEKLYGCNGLRYLLVVQGSCLRRLLRVGISKSDKHARVLTHACRKGRPGSKSVRQIWF